MSSITSTVLPTPAPPNIAALPPCASGASRSITLTPVAQSFVVPVWAETAGAVRLVAPSQAVRRLERDRASVAGVEMGLDFRNDDPAVRVKDFDRIVDRRRAAFEIQVDHGAVDCGHPALAPL